MPLSRRKLLIGAGGIVAGGGALIGTGAFTTVQAERTVEVSTAGDDSALLSLDTIPSSPNSTGDPSDSNNNGYAEITNGTLEVTIPNVNLDAVTHIDNVFRVTNNGTQPVALYFQEQPPEEDSGNDSGNAIDIGAKTSELVGNNPSAGGNDGIAASDVVDISNPSAPSSSRYSNLGVRLGVGDTLWVGFYIDTSDDNLNDGLDADDSESSGADAGELLMDGLVIYANAEEADNTRFEAKSGNH